MREKILQKTRYVPVLSCLISVIEGRNIVGLGDMSISRSLSVGENEIVIKKSYYTNTNVGVIWNNLASGKRKKIFH